MDIDTDIGLWAKSLGFEGADGKLFRDTWIKLVPPSMRSVWRHIISHVLPAKKATYIRKHCLLYKLELQGAANQGIKADVKSLKEYEKYMQINGLKVNLDFLYGQIDNLCSEIKELLARLDSLCAKNEDIKEKEEEKLIKCKLIELKIKSTKEEINKLKEMESIMDYYIKARPFSFAKNDDRWGKEVVEYCEKLPEGEEIDKLCEQLDSLLQTTLKVKINNNREKKEEILIEIQLLCIQTFLEVDMLRRCNEILKQKINHYKENIIKKFDEHHGLQHQSELLNFTLTSNIQDILDRSEAAELRNLQNSWSINRNCSKTEQYLALKKEISLLDEQIENKIDSIATSMHGQKKLMQFCLDAQQIMKEEPKNILSKIKANHSQLVQEIEDINFLPQEVELFLKTPTIRKSKNTCSQPLISNPTVVECLKKLEKYNKVLAEFKFEFPNVVKSAAKDIKNIKFIETTAAKQLNCTLERIKETVKDIQRLKLASADTMEFWKMQPLAEGTPSCPKEYTMWRERCKEAMKTIRVFNEEFDKLDDTCVFSSPFNSGIHLPNLEED